MDVSDQTKTAAALLLLLSTEQLPACQWIVYHEFGLEGWVRDDPDSDPLFDINVWAKKLGADIHRDGSSRILYVNGTYSHVPVSIRVKERDGSYR
jgi:hypothetical protein